MTMHISGGVGSAGLKTLSTSFSSSSIAFSALGMFAAN